MKKYSIIAPIYNEEYTVILLCKQIKKTMDKIAFGYYEIILVNDGSTDESVYRLKTIISEIKELIIINLDKNYGQSLAIQAGFDIALGEIVVTLDGDLQDNPEDIPRLLNKMQEGYEVVCGFKKNKHKEWYRKLASCIANYIRRLFFREKIRDVGCMFRAYKRSVLAGISLDGCKHRFFTAILAKQGAKMCEIEVKSYPRPFGVSKYGIIDRIIKSIPEIFDIYLSRSKDSNIRKYNIKEIIKYE